MPKFLANVNLSQNELQNARIQNLAADPESGLLGQVYYNTASNALKVCVSTSPLTFSTLSTGTVADATTSSKGIIQLAGDLSGTASSPQIATGVIENADINSGASISYSKLNLSGSIVNSDISSSAAIALSKLATDPLARANHTGSQAASTISDLASVVKGYRLDEFANPNTSVSLNSNKITNLATPTSSADAATKAYVDSAAAGIDWKGSVRVATTANITLSGTQTIDGVAVSAGDRVLVKDQSTASANGIYVVAASSWSRATDADIDAEVTGGLAVWVNEGSANADSGWVVTTNDTITVGTTSLTFTQFTGLGQITAGDGLTKTGNTIDVVGTADKITANANAITIASTYAGQSSITTLGTVSTGTWQGTTVALGYGGTGASTAAGARQNLSATGSYSSATHSSGATITVAQSTHGLNAGREMLIQVAEVSSGDIVYPDVSVSSGGDVTISFSTSVNANTHRVTIIGKS
jgi:hypothetical protein